MRVAIATESYWPDVNGVANSVVRVGEHLTRLGHDPLVIAPRPATPPSQADPGLPVVHVPGMGLPGYADVRMALPTRRIEAALRRHQPDVLHLASPFIMGAWASAAGERLGIPMVAVFQTDVPGFARPYGLGFAERMAWRVIRRIHRRAACTLAPSSSTAAELTAHDVPRVDRWGRGVDTTLFDPHRRSAELRRELAPNGELIVGFVGRLAPEKRVDLLGPASELPGVQVVIVGDGPTRAELERQMPRARFLGTRVGVDLARAYASLDVFVHTGPHDTFCQAIQEALASGLPVIAPAAGGPLDLVAAGRTGLLVPPCDEAALAAAVRRLGADARLRASFGAAAREAVIGRDWESTVDQLIEYYHAAIENAGRPRPRTPVLS
jgi:phosphatidylinositol alpha 1,6-mannosyltransferase